MKINLTKREIEFILDTMSDYWIVGDYEITGRVTTKQYNTAHSIKEKLKDIFD